MSDRRHQTGIWLELGPSGAQQGAERGDVVVIIDALRASVTVMAGLEAGAQCVIPVLTVEEANDYLDRPGYLVAGERGGKQVPGFHFGNSPTEILAHRDEVQGQVLVVTTSNGTRCVNAALEGASDVLVGSTVNAASATRAAFSLSCDCACDVTLVAAGLGGSPADEDTFAQRLLAGRLVDLGAVPRTALVPVDEQGSLGVFLGGEAAGRLTELGYRDDIRFCAQIDVWDTVPIYRSDGFYEPIARGSVVS